LFNGWGFAPDHTGGAHSSSPKPPSLKRGGEMRGRGGEGKEGNRRGWKGSEERLSPLKFKSGYTPLVCV